MKTIVSTVLFLKQVLLFLVALWLICEVLPALRWIGQAAPVSDWSLLAMKVAVAIVAWTMIWGLAHCRRRLEA